MDNYQDSSAVSNAPYHGKSRLFNKVARISCFLGGVSLIIILVSICVHIFSRIFVLKVSGADEIAKYAMASSGFFGFAYAFAEKAQVRVDLVLGLLGRRVRRYWEIILSLALGAGMVILIYYWGKMTYSSFVFGSKVSGYLPIKAWILQSILLVGLVIFLFQIALYIHALIGGADSSEIEATQTQDTVGESEIRP